MISPINQQMTEDAKVKQNRLAADFSGVNAFPKPNIIELNPSLNALLIELDEDGRYRLSIACNDAETKARLEQAAYQIRAAIPYF